MINERIQNRNPSRIPIWLRLRIEYNFATDEERLYFKSLLDTKDNEEEYLPKDCAPSGCRSAGETGGCAPGTSCLFSALQPEPDDCAPSGCESASNTGGCAPGTACLFACLQSKQD